MHIRLGQKVHATDGPYGTVADICFDHVDRTVTHVVVDPDGDEDEGRVVPCWLLEERDDVLVIQLDTTHVRRLDRSDFSEYPRVCTADEHVIGRLQGVDVDDERVTSVVVRAGLPGLRHDVLVPATAVHRFDADRFVLALTRRTFHTLPKVDVPTRRDDSRWSSAGSS